VFAMLLYVIVIGGLIVLLASSIGALREAVRQRARPRGFAIALTLAIGSLVGIWAVLV
jgi:hypothetical protein